MTGARGAGPRVAAGRGPTVRYPPVLMRQAAAAGSISIARAMIEAWAL